MGNLCGKESSSSNFHGEGRTLGSAPAARPAATADRAPIPAAVGHNSATAGPGRTLGGAGVASGDEDPRDRAAKAAEERASKNQGTGKLGKALAAQKKQTRSDVLIEASRENRGARDADAGHEARAWN